MRRRPALYTTQTNVHTAGVRGKSITLKLKRRQAGAPAPWKMLGHGPCDNLSRSVTLGAFTDSQADILRETRVLLAALAVPAEDVRGIGITVGPDLAKCLGVSMCMEQTAYQVPLFLRGEGLKDVVLHFRRQAWTGDQAPWFAQLLASYGPS